MGHLGSSLHPRSMTKPLESDTLRQREVASVPQISVQPNLNSGSSAPNLIPLILLIYSVINTSVLPISQTRNLNINPSLLNCTNTLVGPISWIFLTSSCFLLSLCHCLVRVGVLSCSHLFHCTPTSSPTLGLRLGSAGMLVKH